MNDVGKGASFRRQSVILIVICGSLFLLSSLLIKPLYIFLNSDIVWRDTLLIPLFEMFLDLCEILAYSTGFASVIYSVFFGDKKETGIIFAEFIGLTFFRRIIDIIMTIAIYGFIDGMDIISVLFAVAMEGVQLLGVYLIAKALFKKGLNTFIPFKKIYSKKNSLQVSALCAGGVLSAVKVVSRIIYDISYGLPESFIEILSMVLFYSLDILVAIIAYMIIIFMISKIQRVNIFENTIN